jgi:hypothetical protein
VIEAAVVCRNGPGEGALAPHSEKYPLGFLQQLKLVLKRQVTLFVRDPVMVRARMMQCIMMGLIIGGLWFQLGSDLDDTRCVCHSYPSFLRLEMRNYIHDALHAVPPLFSQDADTLHLKDLEATRNNAPLLSYVHKSCRNCTETGTSS